jgi:hypothetical protein
LDLVDSPETIKQEKRALTVTSSFLFSETHLSLQSLTDSRAPFSAKYLQRSIKTMMD